MKTKTFFRFLVSALVIGMLASCSTSNRVASSFNSRKYNKGFFFDRPSKPNAPAINTASISLHKSNNTAEVATNVSNSQKTINVSSSPATIKQENRIAAINRSNKVAFTKSTKEATNLSTVVATNVSSSTLTNKVASNNSPSISAGTGSSGYGGGNCKSWITAVLLCFFLGGIGIHRFYLGYTWQGVVQLLTAGGCGIWALIDFIRILMKSLKPKNGDYCN